MPKPPRLLPSDYNKLPLTPNPFKIGQRVWHIESGLLVGEITETSDQVPDRWHYATIGTSEIMVFSIDLGVMFTLEDPRVKPALLPGMRVFYKRNGQFAGVVMKILESRINPKNCLATTDLQQIVTSEELKAGIITIGRRPHNYATGNAKP